MPCTLPASLADAAVCRGSFHAVLGGEAGEAVFADFSAALQKAQAEGRILTASLFRYENQLFFYAEGLNRPFTPQGLCPALDAALLPWPPALGEAAPRPWAAMQPYFYHDVPPTAADWPVELALRAGSLYPGGPAPVSRAALAGAIARELLSLCPAFDCLDEYRARCFVPGHWVTVCTGAETYAAKALFIDDAGRLVVEREGGRQIALQHGEVSIRPTSTI